jgi:hypothetical protein
MENRENRKPTGQESDISKAQSPQQPAAQAGQQPETNKQREQQPAQTGQFETAQQGQQPELGEYQQADSPDEGLQGETATQQRTDIEGASLQSEEEGGIEIGFVGSQGERDTSGELVDKKDLGKGGQGTPEGK